MNDRTEPTRGAVDVEIGPIVASEPLLARFLIGELESSDYINNLLALFDEPQEILVRRVAGHTAAGDVSER
jgi:hypothetical protein